MNENKSLLYQRWETTVQNGDFAQANKYYQKMLKDQIEVEKVHYVMGLWYRQHELFTSAINAFKRELALDPEARADIVYEMAHTFQEEGELTKAEAYFQEAIALKPDYIDAIFSYGQLLANGEKSDSAIEQFYKASALGCRDVDIYINIAMEISNLSFGEQAIELYFMALIIEPENYYLYSDLGAEFAELGDFETAVFCHEKALSYNNFVSDLWYNLACTYSLMEDAQRGLFALEKALTLDSNNRAYAGIDPELDFLHDHAKFWKMISE